MTDSTIPSSSVVNVRGGARYDVIVIGAGGVGSAAAYHCARDGKDVLLLEQFTVGHTRGSSHGGSRIIRYTHDKLDHASQMPATFDLWFELERESGASLLTMTGGLYFAPENEPWLTKALQVLQTLDFPHRILVGEELQRAHPQFNLPAGWIGVEQEHSGILAASRAVAVMVSQAVRHGASVRELAAVAGIAPEWEGAVVRLETGETFSADRVIVCAGPWASRFLDKLVEFPVPLRVTPQQVAYFPVQDAAAFAVGRFPLFISTHEPHFYGFPIHERPGTIKIALENEGHSANPDDPRQVDQALLNQLTTIVGEFMRGVGPTPVHVEPCLYTETPTRDFIIDRHPDYPQILFGAGFSGRGFKHTIAVGRLLADLAQSDAGVYASPFWRESYRINRFVPVST
ncbi:MAG: N-methyl-L-tryptophan oxidase [Caldilineaceae bacterium]|nr:N-methyl-L-tryptophan oxidase [Caldilineaceae bacterium]